MELGEYKEQESERDVYDYEPRYYHMTADHPVDEYEQAEDEQAHWEEDPDYRALYFPPDDHNKHWDT